MTKYIAIFADGCSITRKSDHVYTVAWRATWAYQYTDKNGDLQIRYMARTGFAKDERSANPDAPHNPKAPFAYRGCSSNTRSLVKRMNEEYRKEVGYRVEFTPAVEVGA